MAKLDSSTLQNNSALESSATDVPHNAEGISRRSLMNVVTAVAAAPVVAFVGTSPSFAERPGRSAWDEALAAYRREVAAYERSAMEYEAACRAHDNDSPPEPELSAVYKVETFEVDRDRLIRSAQVAIAARDYPLRGAQHFSPRVMGEIAEKATLITDEYLLWRNQHKAAWQRFKPAEEKHDAACDRLWKARDRLLNTPAPDAEAMLLKLDVLAEDMRESCVEDAPRVASLRGPFPTPRQPHRWRGLIFTPKLPLACLHEVGSALRSLRLLCLNRL